MSALNIGEKIAAAYLRLNGFLLLPHFTVFIDNRPRHIDLIGLRAAESEERPLGKAPCLLDDAFFKRIEDDFKISTPKSAYLGIVVEVRTNDKPKYPEVDYCEYARRFLGKAQRISVAFVHIGRDFAFEKENPVFKDTLVISLDRALKWVFDRIAHMENDLKVRKTESWYQSDEFLADILILRRHGMTRV